MEDTKRRLVEAALSLMEEDPGGGGPTMRAIARRAGVGLGSVNYHFGSKEQLLSACGAQLARRAMENWRRALEARPRADALGLWAEFALEAVCRAPGAFWGLARSAEDEARRWALWEALLPPEGGAELTLLWAAMRGAVLDGPLVRARLGLDCARAEDRRALAALLVSRLGPGRGEVPRPERGEGRKDDGA